MQLARGTTKILKHQSNERDAGVQVSRRFTWCLVLRAQGHRANTITARWPREATDTQFRHKQESHDIIHDPLIATNQPCVPCMDWLGWRNSKRARLRCVKRFSPQRPPTVCYQRALPLTQTSGLYCSTLVHAGTLSRCTFAGKVIASLQSIALQRKC